MTLLTYSSPCSFVFIHQAVQPAYIGDPSCIIIQYLLAGVGLQASSETHALSIFHRSGSAQILPNETPLPICQCIWMCSDAIEEFGFLQICTISLAQYLFRCKMAISGLFLSQRSGPFNLELCDKPLCHPSTPDGLSKAKGPGSAVVFLATWWLFAERE